MESNYETQDTELSKLFTEMIRKILIASHKSGEGHIPSALSILDILYCVHFVLPKANSWRQGHDFEFLLSKGHASLALYAILDQLGQIESNWFEDFCSPDSPFGGHPDSTKIPSVIASTGSLGHGLPLSVGRALGHKIRNSPKEVICLIGDGELNEGSNWESLLLVENFHLEKLTVILDLNNSTLRSITVSNIRKKVEAFGFSVFEVNGHCIQEILDALTCKLDNGPRFIIANTIKGYRVKSMESRFEWHHKSPSAQELDKLIMEIS
jgi:transketolase